MHMTYDDAINELAGMYRLVFQDNNKGSSEDKIKNQAIDMAIGALKTLKRQSSGSIEPKPCVLENETKEWLDAMTPAEAFRNIADTCIDWDGYRTRDGLGELINEIWAYARYCEGKCEQSERMNKIEDSDGSS